MFDFFKKRKKENELDKFLDGAIRPMALAVALAELVAEHFDGVRSGVRPCPAHRMKSPVVQDVWTYVRYEFFRHFFGRGSSNLALLGEPFKQEKLLHLFVVDRLQFSVGQPFGDEKTDTLQAISQAYLYLSKIGDEIMDRETQSFELKKNNKNIYYDIEHSANYAFFQWKEFNNKLNEKEKSKLPPQSPKTLLELIYEDVTRKSKSIAISTVFGPMYESGMQHMINLVRSESGEAAAIEVEHALNRMLSASQPEDISNRVR